MSQEFTIYMQRLRGSDDASIGLLAMGQHEEAFQAFTCEDQFQAAKKKGETRIPAGRYKVEFNQELTPMTVRYRAKFPWFNWHLEIKGIDGFSKVYFHIGNDDDDTDGCVLVGSGADLPRMTISNSTEAYTTFYQKVSALLTSGVDVYVEIADEKEFKAAIAA